MTYRKRLLHTRQMSLPFTVILTKLKPSTTIHRFAQNRPIIIIIFLVYPPSIICLLLRPHHPCIINKMAAHDLHIVITGIALILICISIFVLVLKLEWKWTVPLNVTTLIFIKKHFTPLSQIKDVISFPHNVLITEITIYSKPISATTFPMRTDLLINNKIWHLRFSA